MNYMIDTPEWFNASVLGTAGGWNWFYIGWLPVVALIFIPLAFSPNPLGNDGRSCLVGSFF